MFAKMTTVDLNLLLALDVLLAEESIVRAAPRLGLSVSATSRTLTRLREATGDPLLVRAGRILVPTPRAIELRNRVGEFVRNAQTMLRPAPALDLAKVEATFRIRSSEGFVDNFGPALLARIARDAPAVRLHFIPKHDRSTAVLRDGSVDLDTGVVSEETDLEVRQQLLFEDRFIGVVRAGHPLTRDPITASRYAAQRHIAGPGRPGELKPVDEALARLGLARDVATVVTGFASALALVRKSDLVAAVPEKHTASMRAGLFAFSLPLDTPAIAVSMLWHPRLDADPLHKWLRACVRGVCI
jgi:DNA-binding transcriptional LysR family regulator